MNIQAIQAYAALCQAEALERIADALAITDEERELLTIRKQFSQDLELLKAEQIQGGKGDQSIADAISERPILCLDCKERIPSCWCAMPSMIPTRGKLSRYVVRAVVSVTKSP